MRISLLWAVTGFEATVDSAGHMTAPNTLSRAEARGRASGRVVREKASGRWSVKGLRASFGGLMARMSRRSAQLPPTPHFNERKQFKPPWAKDHPATAWTDEPAARSLIGQVHAQVLRLGATEDLWNPAHVFDRMTADGQEKLFQRTSNEYYKLLGGHPFVKEYQKEQEFVDRQGGDVPTAGDEKFPLREFEDNSESVSDTEEAHVHLQEIVTVGAHDARAQRLLAGHLFHQHLLGPLLAAGPAGRAGGPLDAPSFLPLVAAVERGQVDFYARLQGLSASDLRLLHSWDHQQQGSGKSLRISGVPGLKGWMEGHGLLQPAVTEPVHLRGGTATAQPGSLVALAAGLGDAGGEVPEDWVPEEGAPRPAAELGQRERAWWAFELGLNWPQQATAEKIAEREAAIARGPGLARNPGLAKSGLPNGKQTARRNLFAGL